MEHSIAVVVCAHTMDRLSLTRRCLDSIAGGSLAPSQTVVVVDNNSELLDALLGASGGTSVEVISSEGKGASAARNTGANHCEADVIAFIDDDAWAEKNWLEELAHGIASPGVVGAGGRVIPDWAPGSTVIPEELLWIVGCTYKGHPQGEVTITRPIGANMAVSRAALLAVGGFPRHFGPREGRKTSSNEELALFTLLRGQFGQDCALYVPAAVVHHHVPPQRTSWQYLVERSWAEGTSKADARREFGGDVMAHDSQYVTSALLPGVKGYLTTGLPPAPASIRDAMMCLVSLGVTAGGYGLRLGKGMVTGASATSRHS